MRASISGYAVMNRHSRGTSHFAVTPGGRAHDDDPVVTGAIEPPDRVAHGGEAGVQARVEQASGIRQLDRAGPPVKEREPEQLLQAADLMAQRSRRDVKLLGSPREAEMTGDGLEGPECVQRGKRARHQDELISRME